MGVLTKKEYENLSKSKKPAEKDTGESPEVSKKIPKALPKKIFVLLHPDNPIEERLNFEDELILEGTPYKRVCENGVVKTRDKILADFLIAKGYEVLEILDVGEE